MRKLEDGSGYMLYGYPKSGALTSVFIPAYMDPEELIAVLADMKPAVEAPKKKASKKKGGDGK